MNVNRLYLPTPAQAFIIPVSRVQIPPEETFISVLGSGFIVQVPSISQQVTGKLPPKLNKTLASSIIPEFRVQIPPRELFLRCFFLVRFSIIFGNYQVLQPGIAAKHD